MPHKAIIISAPSGAGKSTIVGHLLKHNPRLAFSVSACSRAPRKGEVDGKDYFFLSADCFREKIRQGAFLEWEEVYSGHYYGTLRSEMDRIWNEGNIPVFDVDVTGGLNLKRQLGASALSIFIMPPSLEVLEQRLRNRGTDSEESVTERIRKAELELTYSPRFDRMVVNDNLGEAIRETTEAITLFTEESS